MILNVYDTNCDVLAEIFLPDLKFVNGRTSLDEKTGLYYKGAGTLYTHHYSLEEKYNVIKKIDINYIGYEVCNDNWKGKFGIFLERYQPAFTDPVGGCGKKEEKIVWNSMHFGRSAIVVKDVIDFHNSIKIYALEYRNGKTKWLNNPHMGKVRYLLDFMLMTDWNCPWDKNILADIDEKGDITDVADLFESSDIIDKFCTVYGFLSCIYNSGFSKDFSDDFGYDLDLFRIPFLCFKILSDSGYNISSLLEDWYDISSKTYKHIILNTLFRGKNCASLSNNEYFHNLAVNGYKDKLLC